MKHLILILISVIQIYAVDTIKTKNLNVSYSLEIDSINNNITFKKNEQEGQFDFDFELKNDSTGEFVNTGIIISKNYSIHTVENIEKGKLYEYNYASNGYYKYYDERDGYPFRILGPRFNSYVATGYEIEPYSDRRTILILVDRTLSPDLETELNQLRKDLLTEGWGVRIKEVDRMVEYENYSFIRVEDILELYIGGLKNYLRDNPNLNTEAILTIGKTPKFYSGKFAPDDKADHIGAWVADGLLGMKDNFISKNKVQENSNLSRFERNNYRINFIYFNLNKFPKNIEPMIGSLDLSDLPSFEETEVELLRRYLNKNHKYRTGQIPIRRRGLIDDNLPVWSNEDAPASSGWRNFNAMFGPDSIDEADYFTTLENESYLASYACGVGEPFDSLAGVGSSDDFANRRVNTVFTMLYGDYIGDWDSPNNFLRASLASEPSILNVAWVGHPHWFFHHLSVGYPIGYSTRLTMNNKHYDSMEYFPVDSHGTIIFEGDPIAMDPYRNGVHMAMLGDPTLTMYPLSEEGKVANLEANKINDFTVQLSWAVPEDIVHYYDVFRTTHEFGPFEKVNDEPLTTGNITDVFHYTGDVWYMVRERVLEYSPTASFWKHLRGEIVQTQVTTTVELTDTDEVVIYPNPTMAELNLDNLDFNQLTNVRIYDSFGKLVLSIGTVNTSDRLDVENLPAGVYFLKSNEVQHKFVKY